MTKLNGEREAMRSLLFRLPLLLLFFPRLFHLQPNTATAQSIRNLQPRSHALFPFFLPPSLPPSLSPSLFPSLSDSLAPPLPPSYPSPLSPFPPDCKNHPGSAHVCRIDN
ncbi:unnamed protein product [Gadus morhua 'NCC']